MIGGILKRTGVFHIYFWVIQQYKPSSINPWISLAHSSWQWQYFVGGNEEKQGLFSQNTGGDKGHFTKM